MKKDKLFCDLHTHSNYSDGELSPRALVERAARYGLAAVSITDHDTVNGQKEAMEAGRDYAIEVIPGAELSTREGDTEVHILCYFIDLNNSVIEEKFNWLREKRRIRAREIINRLSDCGITISFDDLLNRVKSGSIGRPHVAMAMLEKGVVSSVQEAFNRFLGYGGKAYVPKEILFLDEVMELILTSGGVPVWAHPGSNIKNTGLLKRLINAGLVGIEVWHPNHNSTIENSILKIASERKLIPTGGSDFHSHAAMKVDVGGKVVSYESVSLLKKAASLGHLS
ncbi:PHP domain-containing protein [bacterium]|nr:PHP domain-containing protein [bacterium]